jgi:hypothetical protein
MECTGNEASLELCPKIDPKDGSMDKEIALTCFDYNITGASFHIGSACLYFISFDFFKMTYCSSLELQKKKIMSFYFSKNQKCQLSYLDTFVQNCSVGSAIAQSVK